MFNIGDLIIYSTHGICQIDEICERTYSDVTRKYYILHPIEDPKLTISTPVDNDSVVMVDLLHKEEAEEILESFKQPGIGWIEKNNLRLQMYSDIIKTGNRKDIAKIINTMLRKKHEAEHNGKKLCAQDSRFLNLYQKILFSELAISLNTTYDAIFKKADRSVMSS